MKKKAIYNELLFKAAAAVLPAVVLKAPENATPGEMVDNAIHLAKDLLAELGYPYDGDYNAKS